MSSLRILKLRKIGKSVFVINVSEEKEPLVIPRRKKIAQKEKFLRGIIGFSIVVESLKEGAFTEAKLDKEVSELDDI